MSLTYDLLWQNTWNHPLAGTMQVPPLAPPPPPQGALASPTHAYQQHKMNCPAETACENEVAVGGDSQLSGYCSKHSVFGDPIPTGCDALSIQSRVACAGQVCQR